MSPAELAEVAGRIESQLKRLIVGQEAMLRDTLVALLAGGHVLYEGVPGLGKTVLVRALGQVLGLGFSRVQFTPDLMPADITGTTVLSEGEEGRALRFAPGPIFAQLVLADEINRATPKTQSALLEAMAERTVTVSGSTRALPEPFFVLATQNPIELEGTYPLPEAQLDRFMFKVLVPFPSNAELAEIARRTTGPGQTGLETVAGAGQLGAMASLARSVPLAEHVLDYAVRLVSASHPDRTAVEEVRRSVRFGSSPRGLQALVLGAKVRAMLEGRSNVAYTDVGSVARPALRHRVLLNFDAEASGRSSDAVIEAILAEVPAEPLVAGRARN